MDESPADRARRARLILDDPFLKPPAALRAFRLGWSLWSFDRRAALAIMGNAAAFLLLWVFGGLALVYLFALGNW